MEARRGTVMDRKRRHRKTISTIASLCSTNTSPRLESMTRSSPGLNKVRTHAAFATNLTAFGPLTGAPITIG